MSPAAESATPALAAWQETYAKIGKLLFENTLEPTPDNYALWYRYLSGSDGAFNSQVERAIEQSGGLTAVAVAAINAQRNLEMSSSDLSRMANDAQKYLEAVSDVVGQSSDDAREYGTALEDNVAGLATGAPPSAVESLLQLTRAMIEKTRIAEESLRKTGEEITALRDDLATAQRAATTDGLTGLSNRRSMDAQLEAAFDAARRGHTPLSVAICDIDHFKKFNDTFGHQIGDEVLKFVASSLAKAADDRCFVGRFGGEEFVLLFEGRSAEEAAAELDRIRAVVAARELKVTATGQSLGRVSFSAGVAMIQRRGGPSALLKRADAALYRAKDQGRNRVLIAGDDE